MYRWLRNTHLLLGLFSFAFLLMYGISAVQMSHNAWFKLKPRVSESTVTVAAGQADARAVARELMDRHGLRGEITQVRASDGGWSFRIVRPGTVCEVAYAAASGETKIRTNVAGFMGMLNRIHHAGGLWHEYRLLNIWGFFVGLVSLALIVSALTGLYLWFKLYNERLAGAILLALSLGYSFTLMVLLRV